MKHTLTVQAWVDVLNAVYSCQDLKGLKFAEKAVDLISILEKELEPLNRAMAPSPEFAAFAERVRTEAGNDLQKVKELEDQNPDLVNQRREQLDTLKLLLEEQREISVPVIERSILPKEISIKQLKGLTPILK